MRGWYNEDTDEGMEVNKMAVSKNNRRKPKKRTKNHAAPQGQTAKQSGGQASASKQKMDLFGLTGFALMLAGFLAATFTPYQLIFYPITFIGALMCLLKTKWDTRTHKISFVCYIVYCAAVAVMWVGLLTGKITG